MLTRPLAAALMGLVVLSACTNEAPSTAPRLLPPTTPSRLIVGGAKIDLGTLGGTSSVPRAINNLGQVVGYSSTATSSTRRPFFWSDGTGMRDLGTLIPAPASSHNASASAINDSGQVVGEYYPSFAHAFLWKEGQAIRDLGTLGGNYSTAEDINNAGQVVGDSRTVTGANRAFLWQEGQPMKDLGSLYGGSSYATAINDSGVVVGGNSLDHATGVRLLDFKFPSDGIVWDGAHDFSLEVNPNGSWSSGWVSTFGEKLVLFQKTTPLSDGALTAWVDPSLRARYTPMIARNESGKRMAGIDPGQIALIPGCDPSAPAVLRWTAPKAGSYAVAGRFFEGDAGDASAYILTSASGGKPIFSVSSTKGGPTFELPVDLAAGEYLDFAVAAGRDGCEQGATPLDVRIELRAK